MVSVWENYVWDHPIPATEEEVQAVEQALGIRFPEDFRQIAMSHQGQTPRPNTFTIIKNASILNNLFVFRDEPKYASFLHNHHRDEEYVPAGVYAFAADPGGNKICFDFRASATAPSVVFNDVEQEGDEAIIFLAPSFAEFLASLY